MIYEKDKNKFMHSKTKDKVEKKSGGWFSCFSSTAVEYPAPNMRN